MKHLKSILAILLAGVWINLSEFFRNKFLIHDLWIEHYQKLGIEFPDHAINNVVWAAWATMLAVAIFLVLKKFTLWQTTFLIWFVAFVMMWTVIGNLSVLPYGILTYAIPLTILEVFVAALIIKRVIKHNRD